VTYGVGPQKIEKEKTCKIAKAMRVSPNDSSHEPGPPYDYKLEILPPCLLRGVSSSTAVPAGARVK
jgi:hypothetical protein